MENSLLTSVPVMLCLTLGAYLLGVYLKTKAKTSLLHPFLIAIPTIVAVLYATDTPYEAYREANTFIHFLLGPSVVALGLMLYDHVETIRRHALSIFVSVLTGSIVGVGSVFLLCRLLGLGDTFFFALAAKSVTTPIAMDVAAPMGGNVSLCAVSVVFTGFLGATFGTKILSLLGKRSAVARGLAFGCAAHGLGTARAIELGAVEGAVSGLAIALMGAATAIIAPLFRLIM